MSGALIIRDRPGGQLRERAHKLAGWLGPRLGLLGLGALLLAACGLEPRYALPPPERDDGTFLWVNALDAAPAGYLPVAFDDPETGEQLAVCRGWIVDGPEPDQGYHTGELRRDGNGEAACFISHRGDMLRFARRENAYQQLWGLDGVPYRWVPTDTFFERPISRSTLWTANRVPGDFVRRIDSNAPVEYWLPCAVPLEGRWHLGKLGLQDRDPLYCYIQLDDREVGVKPGVLILFAPVE